jgi:hypothetical protein
MLIHNLGIQYRVVNHLVIKMGMSLGFLCCLASPSFAVEPVIDAVGVASPSENRSIPWSQVMTGEAGPIVYDRHRIQPSLLTKFFLPVIGVLPNQEQSEILSSWSRSGIRVTRIEMVQVVDEVGRGRRPAKFVHREEARETSPLSIEVLIEGRSVCYESGPVSAELAAALARVNEGNVLMKLHWPDGSMTESRIGEGTVLGWKQIFR